MTTIVFSFIIKILHIYYMHVRKCKKIQAEN